MEDEPSNPHGDIKPGDVTVAQLPQGYGYIYGRVIDPATHTKLNGQEAAKAGKEADDNAGKWGHKACCWCDTD